MEHTSEALSFFLAGTPLAFPIDNVERNSHFTAFVAVEGVCAMVEPERSMEALGTLLTPWRWVTSPVFAGLDHVPEDRPVLFVANHTLMGMLDVPLLMSGLWEKKKICVHSLGDRLHFKLPGWRDLVQSFGVIEGSRENCR
jgi:hypothetical protein